MCIQKYITVVHNYTQLSCRCEHSQLTIHTHHQHAELYLSHHTKPAAVCGKIPDKPSQFILCSTICTAVEASLTRLVHLCCQLKCTATCQFLHWSRERLCWEYTIGVREWFYCICPSTYLSVIHPSGTFQLLNFNIFRLVVVSCDRNGVSECPASDSSVRLYS